MDYSHKSFPFNYPDAPVIILKKHKEKLRTGLEDVLTKGLIAGDGVDVMARNLRRQVDIGAYNARRLIRTETNRAFNLGSLASYINAGLEFYQFLAKLDHKTSEQCKALDDEIFPITHAVPGSNLPPLHPNCRSCIAPYFPGEEERTELEEIFAGDGNTTDNPPKERVSP